MRYITRVFLGTLCVSIMRVHGTLRVSIWLCSVYYACLFCVCRVYYACLCIGRQRSGDAPRARGAVADMEKGCILCLSSCMVHNRGQYGEHNRGAEMLPWRRGAVAAANKMDSTEGGVQPLAGEHLRSPVCGARQGGGEMLPGREARAPPRRIQHFDRCE